MRLTNEIVKALNGAIENGYESVSDFARQANVSANTITKYLRKETASITDDTWRKIHPLIRPFLPKSRKSDDSHHRPDDLDTDQKVMLDTYAEFPKDLQKVRLAELVGMAKAQNSEFSACFANDNKVLLAAFGAVPRDVQKKVVLEYVALAKEQIRLAREKAIASGKKS